MRRGAGEQLQYELSSLSDPKGTVEQDVGVCGAGFGTHPEGRSVKCGCVTEAQEVCDDRWWAKSQAEAKN